jgi:hypothetical protein
MINNLSLNGCRLIHLPHTGDGHCDEIDTINHCPAHVEMIEDHPDEVEEEDLQQLRRDHRNLLPFHHRITYFPHIIHDTQRAPDLLCAEDERRVEDLWRPKSGPRLEKLECGSL